MLNNKQIESLCELYTLTQDELQTHLENTLGKVHPYTVYTLEGGLVCFPQDKVLPIGLIAHLDTVATHRPPHRPPTRKEILIQNKRVGLSPHTPETVNCLGADDRNGVFMILQVLDYCKPYFPVLIFPRDEEIGCKGTYAMLRELQSKYDVFTDELETLFNLSFLVQMDRGVHGYTELEWEQQCVFYDCDNSDFTHYMENYFSFAYGSFTDVIEWSEFLGIAGVNIGAAYRNEHTRAEETHLTVLGSQIAKLQCIMQDVYDQVQQGNVTWYRYISAFEEKSEWEWFPIDGDSDLTDYTL